MKIRKIITFCLGIMMISQIAMAQEFSFDEMTVNGSRIEFKLFAPPTAKKVYVNIYNNGVDGQPVMRLKMKYKDGLWRASKRISSGSMYGKFYTFDAGFGETPGVFAKAVGVNGKRAAIIDPQKTNPYGWEDDNRVYTNSFADLVIYELHHRDFSIDPSSQTVNRGKFLSLTEAASIKRLTDLGVNAIHILPSYDYGSVDETRIGVPQYNWGYDPVNYNVPEGSYSTNPYDPACRIQEFKKMVQAMHKAGIRVILDVVYNHTFDVGHSNFQRTYPDYYYRLNQDGGYSNGSGCGNETASDKEMMRRFMVESVKYWVDEYHIDGFRFDLMGIHDIETMNVIRAELDKIDPMIFMYGEGWSAGDCAYPYEKLAMKAHTKQLNRIAAFSDDMRDALRGPFSDDTKGAFLAGIKGLEESLKFGIVGAISHPQVDMKAVNYSKEAWANEPTQMISYVSCHDDMCLVDRLRASIPGIKDDELIRLDLLAQTAVFTSQGVPFMLSGEEVLRDKQGVHNSYNSPDNINRIDWTNRERYPQVFNYYSNLIKLRKNHPAFRLGKADLVRKHLEFLPTSDCLVGFVLKDNAGGDAWHNIYVIFNANKEAKEMSVPQGNYTVVCCDGQINEEGISTVEGTSVLVAPQSALIMHD